MNKVFWAFPLIFLVLACLPEAVLNLIVFANRSKSVYPARPAKRIWILRWSLLLFCLLLTAGYLAGMLELAQIAIVSIFAACLIYGVYLIVFVISLYRKAFR